VEEAAVTGRAVSSEPTRRRVRRDWLATAGISFALIVLVVPAFVLTASAAPIPAALKPWVSNYTYTAVQEGQSRVHYTGRWINVFHPSYAGGRARAAGKAAATAKMAFDGTGIAWVGPVGPTRGKARVYIDGKLVKTVNTYATSYRATNVLFKTSFATMGRHAITIQVLGTVGHPTVAIDEFVIRGNAIVSGGGIVDVDKAPSSKPHSSIAPPGPGGEGMPAPGTTPDPAAPAIIDVQADALTTSAATIRWTVSEVATGQVEYGTTTAYGTKSAPELSYSYSTHVQSLTGLRPATTYHFRVVSATKSGAQLVSSDETFTTAGGPVAEPSSAPSAEPTSEPTVAPTPTPTAQPTPAPTVAPTPAPGGTLPGTTTLRALTLPAVPALPAKGAAISDPNGTKVRRIGDSGQRHAYSKIEPWNADGSLLFLAYGGRLVNGATYALVSTAMGNPGNFNWDPTDRRYGYSTQSGETNLYRHDVSNPSAPTRIVLHNFGRAISLGKGEGGIADDGTVAVIDNAGNVATWNVKTNTGSGFWSTGGNPDSVTMSRDGNIVVAVFESGSTGRVNEIWAYNPDGSNAHRVRYGAQHGDTAVSTSGRQVLIQADGQMHDLLTGAATQLFSSSNAFASGHVSGRGPAGGGYYSVYNTDAQMGKPGNDQVVAVKLDGSATVRVFGFANRRGSSYETQPQAVPSRDGTRVLFASDWGNAGTYAFVAGMNP
jgi:hypothetical protein